jgi:hypothetical protein
MYGLTDIFSSSFFMILGIVILLLALLVIYFESKIREQNHKINSMLSLVSSLAEEMNTLRYNFIHSQGGGFVSNASPFLEKTQSEKELIEVSDDDDDDEDEDEEDDDDDDDDDDDKKTVIMGKISISDDDIEEFDLDNDISSMNIKILNFGTKEDSEVDDKDTIVTEKESDEPFYLEIKKNDEELDYKKMTIQKLRSIAIEKGLTNVAKLKKNELLKLLESE